MEWGGDWEYWEGGGGNGGGNWEHWEPYWEPYWEDWEPYWEDWEPLPPPRDLKGMDCLN